MKKYVITGGPGIGKTTTIELLASRGYSIIPEAARIIIEEEELKKSDILPWKNVQKFQERVTQKQLELEEAAHGDIIFLDRGIIDGYGYCKVGGVQIPDSILHNSRDRYEKVFLLNRLPDYKTDKARLEKEGLASKIHDAVADAYKEFGYDLILVPALPPEERMNFILKNIL